MEHVMSALSYRQMQVCTAFVNTLFDRENLREQHHRNRSNYSARLPLVDGQRWMHKLDLYFQQNYADTGKKAWIVDDEASVYDRDERRHLTKRYRQVILIDDISPYACEIREDRTGE